MECQEAIGILECSQGTEWGLPGLVCPKKDDTIQMTNDTMIKLNKCVICEVYPLPHIQDILHCRRNYKFFTKIDISMQYYTFMLNKESSSYAMIVMAMGKWCRKHVPMGFLGSTDWMQVTTEEIYKDVLNEVKLYINAIRLFHTDWTKHMTMMDLMLIHLEDNGFAINPLKCEWDIKETSWVGHWLTPMGPVPWHKN
jgi:hypothetical protein